ncbi:MAG: HPF/RaiA family ribosome-associated protein, partial [Rhodospirillaceae bacterium]|nr:HPF/RaiA family ribosome-associated protein [Rhodospirillales bacterium]
MQIPLQITFHGIDHSDAAEERVREKVAKLEQFFDRITSCRV